MASIILTAILVSLTVDDLIIIQTGSKSQQVISSSFSPYDAETSEGWTLDTTDFTQAGMLSWNKTRFDYDIQTVAQIQFYSETLTVPQDDKNPVITYEWYNSTKCSELYSDAIDQQDVIKREFTSDFGDIWWCPDIKNFTIHNDPVLYPYTNGTNFVMVVNDCNTAQKVAEDNGLSWDTKLTCNSDAADLISNMTAWSKMMTQDAMDKDYYEEHGSMQTYFTNR